ncbi:ferrochelatase [Temperatibacter marinus]|uniref:Ferrochelatase n=1 Tax=Temperatibacter marinus TaxID=1456591 RepID=A0AA52HB52_9PROT|nr:ferrochelatase [Temperatibacter marinus]WND03410.1 ferrochelatase [Temperatibacter marinus]
MSDFKPSDHPKVHRKKTGVLLIALGTPLELTKKSLRSYLSEFLGDPRVVEFPNRFLWKLILNGPLLTLRVPKSLKAYAKIWDYDLDESPLRTITREQGEKLAQDFQERYGDTVRVDWAFRYGSPSIEAKLEEMRKAGVERLVCFALYPQYSASTTASSYDEVFRVLGTMRWQPAIRTVPAYFEEPVFIKALADSVKQSLSTLDFEPDHIVASYHSIPKEYWDKGDPYPCHCFKTSRLLSKEMAWQDDFLLTSFQSRVGPKEWVGPETEALTIKLAQQGVKKLVVLTPAFSADCLETLEEINMELREIFLEQGGEKFHMIPCLNASEAGMKMISTLVQKEAQGWI